MTSSEQARKDALADAETLRRALGKPEWDEMDRRTSTRGCVAVAGFYGIESVRWLRDIKPSTDAVLYAESAARAAFRAVPGLRGE